jgi:diguanylate cyclase (GGDEF)-like protein
MAFISALAVSLWKVNPTLEMLLAGPLFALALYQRYAYRTVLAVRDAETDALTALGNHRSFQTDLREALALAASTRSTVSLVLIDLDDFKSINDRYGHPVGDRVLKQVSEILREAFGADSAYRIGGEEFALLLPERSGPIAYADLERVHHRLWQTTFPHGEPVTVSAGVVAVDVVVVASSVVARCSIGGFRLVPPAGDAPASATLLRRPPAAMLPMTR